MAIINRILCEIRKIGKSGKYEPVSVKKPVVSAQTPKQIITEQSKPEPKPTQAEIPQQDTAPEQEPVKEKVYGTRGRLEIPELNISVPLNGTESGGAQKVIDREDSAVYLIWPNNITIADHCHQANFSNLNKSVPGRTKAYIVTPDSKKGYVCYKTQVGHIKIGGTSNVLYDHNWEAVYKKNQGGLTMYTCIEKSAPDVMDVRLTYWKPI